MVPNQEEARRELLKDPVIREFIQIQEQIQLLQDRLKKVELHRSSTRPAVYIRVKQDYTNQIKELLKKVQPQKARLKARLEDMERQRKGVEQTLDGHQEELEEANLRHLSGEYTDDQFLPVKSEIESKISAVTAELEKLKIDIVIYRDYLGVEIAPELIQEVAQELEAQTGGRRAPADSPTPHPVPVSSPSPLMTSTPPPTPTPLPIIPQPAQPQSPPTPPPAPFVSPSTPVHQPQPTVTEELSHLAAKSVDATPPKIVDHFSTPSDKAAIGFDDEDDFDKALLEDEEFEELGPATYIPEAAEVADLDESVIEDALEGDDFSLDDFADDIGDSTIRKIPEKEFTIDAEEDEDDEFARYLEEFDDESPTIQRGAVREEDEFEEEELPKPSIISILEVIEGDYKGQTFPVTSHLIKIGRGPDNDIQLGIDTSVSRHHAQLVLQANRYKLIDLNSSNGTFVNGIRTKEQWLSPNDQLMIGQTRMIFKVPQ